MCFDPIFKGSRIREVLRPRAPFRIEWTIKATKPQGRARHGGRKDRKMRNPLKAFVRSFKPTVTSMPQADPEEDRRRMARNTIRRVATGSVRLQHGRYVTGRDIDRRIKIIERSNFDDGE